MKCRILSFVLFCALFLHAETSFISPGCLSRSLGNEGAAAIDRGKDWLRGSLNESISSGNADPEETALSLLALYCDGAPKEKDPGHEIYSSSLSWLASPASTNSLADSPVDYGKRLWRDIALALFMPSAPTDKTSPPKEDLPPKTKALALLWGQLRGGNGSAPGSMPELPPIIPLSFMPKGEESGIAAAKDDFKEIFESKERRNLLVNDLELAWWLARSANVLGHITSGIDGEASQWRRILAEAAVNGQKIDETGRGFWGNAKTTAFAILLLHEL